MFSDLFSDVRFGIRQLRKSPAFTAAAALTLALGIGANATIFSWMNAIILNPLPRVDSKGLVSVRWRSPEGSLTSFSWPDYLDTRKRSKTIESMSVESMSAFNLGEGTRPERVWGMLVSSEFFRTMGVNPIAGRGFLPDEDENPGGHPVTVISYHLWQTKFGSDPGIVGRQVKINNRNFQVIGIAPEDFAGAILGLTFELYIPISMREVMGGGAGALTQRGSHWLQGQARLKPGVDERQVALDLTGISSQLAHEFLQSDRYVHAEIIPIWREGGGQVLAPIVMLMMAVVGVVLLIACANVANLLLARAAGRRREIAIRQALGVSRSRLIRQLLAENGLLAVLGGAAAMLVVPWAGSLMMRFVPVTALPVSLNIRTDSTVLLFTLGISLVATLLFGLLPALRASRPDVVNALKEDSGGSANPRKAWLRNSLVVAQVALSMVLLVGAGLLLKSLRQATTADPGFNPLNVLVAGVDLVGYPDARGQVAIRQMIEKISTLPGVAAVSTVRRVPLGLGGTSSTSVSVEGYVPAKNEEAISYVHSIGPDYFHTMDTRVVAGREFSPSDSETTQHVVVINQTFARRYFPKVEPVGHWVKLYGEQRIVAGIVRDSKFQSLDEKPMPAVYLPVLQSFVSESNFLVRSLGDPMLLARSVEDAIHTVDPTLPVFGERSLETSINVAYIGQRMGGSLLGVFGALALILAAVGLYGVLAYTVTQRSREVGIRMALGAGRGNVLRLILGQGLRLAGIGLAIGLVIAAAVTRLMTSLLFGVSPTDIPTILLVSSLLALVTVGASLLPAYRATRIDPILAIRYE
jgi:macrolide transport system ATP-binding/permease protein